MTERLSAGTGKNSLIIWVLLAASFVVVLNETLMTVALPKLMVQFDVTANVAQWLTTAYMLTMAVVIPTTGYVIQRFSTRTVFIAAATVFSIGTLLAAIAPDFSMLLGARIVQASGAAVMLPLLMTTVLALAPTGRRGAYMGVVTIVLAVAPAIGPALSGILLQALSWRFLFIILLPIALAALILGIRYLRNVGETTRPKFDALSVVLSLIGFGPLVLGLSQLGEAIDGLDRVLLAVALIVVGSGCVALFVWRQVVLSKRGDPVLDVRVFRAPQFRISLAILLLCMGAYFGTLLILPFYVQRVLGLDTLTTGLIMLPGGLLMGVMGPLSGRVFDRYGGRLPALFGTAVLVLVYTALVFLGAQTPAWLVGLAVAILMGFGMGSLSTPAVTNALEALPPHRYSHGNATIASLQQVAGAAGSAVLVAVLSIATSVAAPGLESDGELVGIRIGFAIAAAIAALAFLLSFRVGKSPISAVRDGDESFVRQSQLH